MKSDYNDKKFQYFLRIMLIAGGIIHGANALTDSNVLLRAFGSNPSRVIMCILCVAAILLMTELDFYLPFLGDAVFPDGLLADNVHPHGADTVSDIVVPPGSKVIFWAAEPCMDKCDASIMAWDAYDGYKNSGIATAGPDGIAQLRFKGPQSYSVPRKSDALNPHVHYRYFTSSGMMSKVYTVSLKL